MAEFEKGQFFIDKRSTNYQRTKSKYFIGLNDADFEDDIIVCFVLNTEHRMDKYHEKCNKNDQKFILAPSSFSFITNFTSIMLSQPCRYFLSEMYFDNINFLDKADDLLCRQIKNCIDWNYIPPKFAKLIKDCFKN